jgi:flagellar basal-body rod modification protein FlgD
MMIAELQNQDPTQPMSTSDILQEVSQIGSIETNSQLTQTLQSVALGENVSTAASLIGRTVAGTNSSQQSVTGTVDGASVQNGAVTLSVGGQSLSLSEISAIQ